MYEYTDHTFSVRFCASFYESDGVLDELPTGFNKLHHLIHCDLAANPKICVKSWTTFSDDVDFGTEAFKITTLHFKHNRSHFCSQSALLHFYK